MKYNPSKKGKYGKWMGNCEKNRINKEARARKEKNRKKTRRDEERQGKETRNCEKIRINKEARARKEKNRKKTRRDKERQG